MITFLYGENSFFSSEKLSQIRKEFGKKNIDCMAFDVSEKSIFFGDFVNAFNSDSLFCKEKVIILKNIFLSKDKDFQEKILDFFNNNPDVINDKKTTIIIWEGNTPRKSDGLFKFLIKNANSKEFKKMNLHDLEKWIGDQFLKNKKQVSRSVIKKIAMGANGDIWRISNEIKKILNYKLAEEKIGREDVDLMMNFDVDVNIFETIEVLLNNDKKKALQFLIKQLRSGTDPFYILSMYIYQCRNLLKMMDLYSHGITNQYEIAKITKLHPFIVQKSLLQLRNVNLMRLKNIYNKLEKIDKNTKTGNVNIKLALTMFVVTV